MSVVLRPLAVRATLGFVPLMRVTDPAKVPPGGACIYKDPETGVVRKHPYLHALRAIVLAFRVQNNLPIASGWETRFEDNVCANTPRCPCEPVEDGARRWFYRAAHFARSMATWARAGLPLLSDEDTQARRAVCEGLDGQPRCPEWRDAGEHGWGFGRCGKCGCSTTLKTMVATEVCPLGKWPPVTL